MAVTLIGREVHMRGFTIAVLSTGRFELFDFLLTERDGKVCT